MPRRSSRSSGSRARSLAALVTLLLFALIAGWWLLRPKSQPGAHRVARIAAPATPAETIAPQPGATETASPESETLQTETPPAAVASEAPSESPAASPTTENPNGPELALIVDDCGQWLKTERGFLALGVPLTISVLPDVRYTAEIAREAESAGKGVMLHLPMEPLSEINPGDGKVTTAMSDSQIVAQVQDDLAQVPSAQGVNNHEGSKASADRRVMDDVLGVVAQHGLFFIDSMTNADSVGEATARTLGVPTAARDVFLDNRADVAYSEGQLLEAAAIARRTGHAIAIGHPKPTTLAAVQALVPQLEASGIHFVLARELATDQPR